MGRAAATGVRIAHVEYSRPMPPIMCLPALKCEPDHWMSQQPQRLREPQHPLPEVLEVFAVKPRDREADLHDDELRRAVDDAPRQNLISVLGQVAGSWFHIAHVPRSGVQKNRGKRPYLWGVAARYIALAARNC